MNGSVAIIMLGLVLAGALLPFLVHLLLIRGLKLFRHPADRQKGAIFSGPIGLIPLLLLFSLLVPPRVETGAETAWTAFYVFGSYACLSYVYFHFFNMSETARRIRILVQSRTEGNLPAEEIIQSYTPEQMVTLRLSRLVSLGELKLENGRYQLGRRGLIGLLFPARIVFAFRKIIFPGA